MIYTITEKNAASIMGKINNFFNHQVREDLGMKKVEVDRKEVTLGSESTEMKYMQPIYELQHIFKPVHLECTFHHMYKAYRYYQEAKRAERFGSSIKLKKPLFYSEYDVTQKYSSYNKAYDGYILALSNNRRNSCIPIEVGHKIEFKGNRITLILRDIPRLSPISGKMMYLFSQPTKACRNTFVHSSYTQEEINRVMSNEILSSHLDNIWEEEYSWYGYNKDLQRCMKSITQFIYHHLEDIVPKIVSGESQEGEYNLGKLPDVFYFDLFQEKVGDIIINIDRDIMMKQGLNTVDDSHAITFKCNLAELGERHDINSFAKSLITRMNSKKIEIDQDFNELYDPYECDLGYIDDFGFDPDDL